MNTYGEISALVERMRVNPFIDVLFIKHESEENKIELYKNIAKAIIDKHIFKYNYYDILGEMKTGAEIMVPRTLQDDLLIYKLKDIEDKNDIMKILYNTNVDAYFRLNDGLNNCISINLYEAIERYFCKNSERVILHCIINKKPITLKDCKGDIILVPIAKSDMMKTEKIYNSIQEMSKDKIEEALKDIDVEIYIK